MKKVMFVIVCAVLFASCQAMAHGTKRPPVGPKPPAIEVSTHIVYASIG